jgi:hypothetical protein
MKDIIKFLVVFGIVYALWNVFWHSVFTAWDLFGLVGVVLLLGIIWNVGRKYLGTSHSPNIVQMPKQADSPSASHEKAGSGPTTSPKADTFSLPQTDDYVTLVAKFTGGISMFRSLAKELGAEAQLPPIAS